MTETFSSARKNDIESFFSDRKYDLFILVAGVFLGLAMDWKTIEIVFFVVFLFSLLWSISSRILVLPAIFFIILVPVLLALNREERAEEIAVYVFYFFCMAVIRMIIEVRQEDKETLPIHEEAKS